MKNKKISRPPEENIKRILEKTGDGRTITELTEISQLSRSAVRTALARLEGARLVTFRPIGMAKVYFANEP